MRSLVVVAAVLIGCSMPNPQVTPVDGAGHDGFRGQLIVDAGVDRVAADSAGVDAMPDLVIAPDLAHASDLAEKPDLSPVVDLASPPDLTQAPDLAGCGQVGKFCCENRTCLDPHTTCRDRNGQVMPICEQCGAYGEPCCTDPRRATCQGPYLCLPGTLRCG